jgi:nucleoside 2-deoxyribosyltransferase
MRVFLICPVRDADTAERLGIAQYVARLECAGVAVHWPARDTDQQDAHGLAICVTNAAAIERADEVHVWWSDASEGSRFDLGMAFALRKPVRLARPVAATPGKSFANVLRALCVEADHAANGPPKPSPAPAAPPARGTR